LDKAATARYVGIIGRESRRLTDLVNTVMDLSRLQAGVGQWDLQAADVCEAVGAMLRDCIPPIAEQGFAFEVALPAAPLVARFDPRALQIVLNNLIDNAVKFSCERKEIAVKVDRQGGNVAISVADKGIGIAESDHERIFDSFFRVEGDKHKRTRGTGVGLALVRQIAEAHGGQVQVKSALGAGATFTVLLPSVAAGN
jgi:signal transduction histidine kinase